MSLSAIRVRAIVRKEMRDYRRNRFIASTMAVMPLVFVVLPIADIFNLPASAPPAVLDKLIAVALLYLTLIPSLTPAVVSSYAVVGEREQGTLEGPGPGARPGGVGGAHRVTPSFIVDSN